MNALLLGAFVALSLFSALAVVLLAWHLRRQAVELSELRAQHQKLNAQLEALGPLMADTRSALRQAERRTTRADDLVIAATAVTERADAASALAYRVAANPLVRALAFVRGLRRGVGALVGKDPKA